MLSGIRLAKPLTAVIVCCSLSWNVMAAPAAKSDKTADVKVISLAEREAANELSSLLSGVKTLSAKFDQQTLDDGGRKLQQSHGTMLLKRPDLFRWSVVEPFPQEVVSDGSRISYYDKDLDQVTLQDLDQRTSATPALLLSGDSTRMLGEFLVKMSKADSSHLFTLIPKNTDSPFQELQLYFKGKTLEEMSLLDTLGSRTRIQFSDVKQNIKAKDKDFELYVPPGTDVIDQTSVALNPSAVKK
ncbi:outer membrane lipoprotein chaperone LolA [Parendozoicomonas sp. Alg238-R29]|uniref:outer membrane lipoprotein chaperone LolA n=1 Tax=Parendozoicomonas sp. Alg238-R29 TaxID=2993446 RepID=UPI00248D803C|nr:outer membrane lipoprotein chaperone LolA [Parendozoicomonas sp. Alg238-R29]